MASSSALRRKSESEDFFVDLGVTTVPERQKPVPKPRFEKIQAHCRTLGHDDARKPSSVQGHHADAASVAHETKCSVLHDAGPDQKWQVEVLKPLAKYAMMAPGWDSYTGLPLRWDAGFFALCVLNSIMRPRTPIPQLVPSPIGGVQLEWHEKDIDLELHITAPYECELWFVDHKTGEQISQEFSNDLSALAEPIAKLTSR